MSNTLALRALSGRCFRAYAAVLFCESPRVGAWFALLTWWSPGAALAGAVGLLAAVFWGRLLALEMPGDAHLVNALLSTLFIGAFHAVDATLIGWVLIVALFVTLFTHWLAGILWRNGKLPVLSLPFVLATWLIILASRHGNPAAMLPAVLSGDAAGVFTPWLDDFFTALGWLLLVPYPLAGALLFAGLVVASRYLAILAVAGYVSGQLALLLFGRGETHLVGFNLMLAAMALGGIFAVPGRASFLIAVAGGALAGWFAVAFGVLLFPLQLPMLTLPFLFAVYLWLGGLGGRQRNSAPGLLLDEPQAPERSYERQRLAQVRGGSAGSVPLQLPFYGEWRVTQAFDGAHTHKGIWRHALDFDIAEGLLNHQGVGVSRRDYFCFDAPVLAPAAAQVVAGRDDLPDVSPGEADVANNWGNYLVLRGSGGEYLLLAHLRQGSLRARVGEWVEAGQLIAACGSSGRAPEPHLHLHAQTGEKPGSPTRPFHLVNVLVRVAGEAREYRLNHVPAVNDLVSAAPRDERLATALHLPAGRCLVYRLSRPGGKSAESLALHSEMTLLGQSRLASDDGASVAYEETPYVVGYYDRQGGRHALLDLWVLALGLTPLGAAAERWSDRPSLSLLPLDPLRRVLAALSRPLGACLDSRYVRSWDETAFAWRQDGTHEFRLLPGISWTATTVAWIAPDQGVLRFVLELFGRRWEAEFESVTIAS